MQDFEKLGVFYLGKEYDPEKKQVKEDLVLYDSRDLTTHAVCVGMTGSGKTGLCIALLEEAAIDGIPAIVIDPKGDMANLLLTFPDPNPSDFKPWVNPDDAREKGLSMDDFAALQAETWKKGLADWGQDGERVRKLKSSVEFVVYTPGSSAGVPVSILKSFDSPEKPVLEDDDLLREIVATTASSLLGFVGIDADPVKSREHILLSNLFSSFWTQGKSCSLAGLIQSVQKPPFAKVGAFDVESFFPAKERFEFAMILNNLLASPSFQAWTEGEPLEAGGFLHSKAGKPKISIFSIAHLSDAERMFFVSLLLNQIVAWMRMQSGTTSLRAILYFDELFGYMPPTAAPPSKKPLLTILKQGRAFGLGTVLATQNPVDLDYKGLANAGTWFIGRLQTERDRERMLDGLSGANQGKGGFDRSAISKTISGLGNRVFLLHNVHEDKSGVFTSRWVMSYLAGPLTRNQIKSLPRAGFEAPREPAKAETPVRTDDAAAADPPSLDPGIPQFFFPVRGVKPDKGRLFYHGVLWGSCKIHFLDPAKSVDAVRTVRRFTPFTDSAVPVDWEKSLDADFDPADFEISGEAEAQFAALPTKAGDVRQYPAWKEAFEAFVFRTQKLELFKSALAGLTSKPEETERDFRARLLLSSREDKDGRAENLREKYAAQLGTLQERSRRAELQLEREQGQSSRQKINTAISIGATLLGAFLGRKAVSTSTVTRAGTAARSASRAMEEAGDVQRARENLELIQREIADLEAKFKEDLGAFESKSDISEEKFETVSVWPKKGSMTIELAALAWMPWFVQADGKEKEAWK
jgi:hypothetical protein